jgi:hypothetical protein
MFAAHKYIYIYIKLHGLSPRANYTDRATAACQRSDCQLLRIDGSLRPYSLFSRQEPPLLYQVAPQLYSRGWVDPFPDPLLFFFSGSAGNRTRTSGFVAKNSDHQTTEAVLSIYIKSKFVPVILRADYVTHLHLQMLALTLPTSGGSSVDIVCSREKATELLLLLLKLSLCLTKHYAMKMFAGVPVFTNHYFMKMYWGVDT